MKVRLYARSTRSRNQRYLSTWTLPSFAELPALLGLPGTRSKLRPTEKFYVRVIAHA